MASSHSFLALSTPGEWDRFSATKASGIEILVVIVSQAAFQSFAQVLIQRPAVPLVLEQVQ